MVRVLKVIVVLAVIGALAAIAYKRGQPSRDVRHPVEAELRRLHADAARLHGDVCTGIESLDDAQIKFGNSVDRVDERVASAQRRVEEAQSALAQRQQALKTYSTLVAKDQGAMLPDGRYVSPDVVRRQYEFERDEVQSLRQKLAIFEQHRDNAERVRQGFQERYDQTHSTLAKLRAARNQLQEQLAHLDLMLQSFAGEGVAESMFEDDVRRLQSDITSIQDQMDVYLRELPEILALQRADSSEIDFSR